jgi:hypothetical protein
MSDNEQTAPALAWAAGIITELAGGGPIRADLVTARETLRRLARGEEADASNAAAMLDRVLRARDPDATITTFAVPARRLAQHSLAPSMRGLPIGSVSVPASSGAHNVVSIALRRDGRLALTIREPGEDVQHWYILEEFVRCIE